MSEDFSIRELIRNDFGVDLPISGGSGNSIDNPVVIDKHDPPDYTSVEYAFLKYIGIGRGIKWKLIKQELLEHEGKSYDKLKIKTVQQTEDEVITQIENYYFDISNFFS